MKEPEETTMSEKSLPFVRFLNLRAAMEANASDQPTMHHDTDELLAYIYERNQAGNVVSMTDLFHARVFGAPPTIQRRIKELISSGLLVTSEGSDKRQRCLQVSAAGERRLEAYSRLLCLVVQGSGGNAT